MSLSMEEFKRLMEGFTIHSSIQTYERIKSVFFHWEPHFRKLIHCAHLHLIREYHDGAGNTRKRNKKGYWSSLRPVPFLNVLCPMAYSSFALSLWSFLRSTLFLFVLIVLRCSWLMSCITECRPSFGCFPYLFLHSFEKWFLLELTLNLSSDLLFDRCDDLKYKIWSIYFSSCTFPVSDQV